ncbi:MAG TPA: helix-turn-helix domain-containing protein [Chitinophagaceae bacterium]|nr:helix-turn-helix domain-containing protein [Chitinophagaceae bacterium]
MGTITPDTNNTIFNIAVDLVNQSSRNMFLTGKAGTGKTTFLKHIRDTCPKQMAIVAPTGVAAINAGGVTIHSFFQLPFSPFVPESKGFNNNNDVADKHSLLSRLRLTGEKKKVIQELELLIIDEISMVRCDTLDAIDAVMRHVRQRRFERFGGVQVLFIGDMYQLPPVVPEQEWRILSEFYNSPYFFDSKVVLEEPPVYIEFTKIYRQSDERFINLLNQVRNNEMDERGMEILDSRFRPVFRRTKGDGYIVLTTHNRKADATNTEELQKITERMHSFTAEVKGDFSEKAYPADEQLLLKVGAQVMFIKNDLEKVRRYFNGKIGTVTRIEADKIYVLCKDEDDEIEVKKETWDNIRYSVNKTNRQLEEEVLGSFTQYPLRLAWAITIHKSQGLTFEKAIIDAGEAFAPGQVYVALSRCISLEGMILQSNIRQSSLHSDNRIVAFSKSRSSSAHLQNELLTAKRNYQLAVLTSVFDFAVVLENCEAINAYITEFRSAFNSEIQEWLLLLQESVGELKEVSVKFQSQLRTLFLQDTKEEQIQERIKAASIFFKSKLEDIIAYLQRSPAVTDSRLHAKEYNDSLKEIFAHLSVKKYLLQGLDNGFNLDSYQQRKKSFVLPAFTVNSYATASLQQRTESPYPALHQQLRKLRDNICAKKDLPVYFVVTGKTLDEMVQYLPQTLEELQKISGFGKAKIESYGQQFLDIILAYSEQHGLSSLIHEKSPKRERKTDSNGSRRDKPDTKALSFDLYKAGKSVADIANERKLTIQTIEGHLAYYIRQGEIGIEELISREKLVIIEPVIKEFNGGSITSIKEKVGSSIGFGEIRLAIAWYDFKRSKEQEENN